MITNISTAFSKAFEKIDTLILRSQKTRVCFSEVKREELLSPVISGLLMLGPHFPTEMTQVVSPSHVFHFYTFGNEVLGGAPCILWNQCMFQKS